MGGRLVGREAELERVAGAVVSAREGASRCLLVTGEAGIGKSRLVSEALAGLDDALVLTGHAVDMSTGEIPFGVVADTLRDLVRVAGADVLLPTERESLAPLLPGAAPQVPVERVQLLSTFLDLLERLASTRLVVWVVEDLHWADSATRDLVSLTARTQPPGLLLVATVRTDDPERSAEAEAALTSYVAGLARTPGCEVLPIARLSADAVQRQLRDLLGSSPSADVANRVERLSDGIPFVVEELVAAAGRPELGTVAAVASGRLGGLAPEARRLVEAAAVGDGHLRISLLEQVLDVTPDELDVALAEALQAGVLTTDHETDAVGFRHALLREATDRKMGPGARRSWHRRWAEVLEANPGVLAADPAALAVAEHWHQVGDVPRALTAAYAALPAVDRIGTSLDGVRLWMRIVDAWERGGDGLLPVTRPVAVAALLREAINAGRGSTAGLITRLGDDPDPRVRHAVAMMAANARLAKGRWAEHAGRTLADSLETDDWPDDDLTALALHLAATSLPCDDPRGDHFLDRSESIPLVHWSSHLPNGRRGMRAMRRARSGDLAGSIEIIYRSLSTPPEMHPVDRWFHEGNLIWSLQLCGRATEALEVAGPALARISHPQAELYAWEHLVENVATAQLLTGDWQDARRLLEANAPYWPDDMRYSDLWLDLLDLRQRGHADLSRWVATLHEVVPGGPLPDVVRRLLAIDAGMRGDVSAMRDLAAPLWRRDEVYADDDPWIDAVTFSRLEADVELDGAPRGSSDGGVHLDVIVEAASEFPRHGALGETWPLDLAAQLDRFHGRDARPALRAALEGWERIGHVPDVAVTHLSLAEQEAMHGDRDAARHHLAAGREIAERLEAQPLLGRADALAERYALSSRERRTDDVLTDREVEVLRLVADGMTNAQIGTRLFMSPKTASVHVSHILAKLGAANRTEAATVARRQGLLAD